MATEKPPLALNPEVLLEFARADPTLPSVITKGAIAERTQEYRYAMAALFCGLCAFMCVVGGFVYLALKDRPRSASGLLAAGVVSLIGAFIRSRLRKDV